MATLDATDRARIWRGLQRYWSNLRTPVTGSKAELLTTVEETDDWIDLAQSNYLNALTYRTNYTAVQLTLIFCCVAAMRVSPTVAALLQRLLGTEVD